MECPLRSFSCKFLLLIDCAKYDIGDYGNSKEVKCEMGILLVEKFKFGRSSIRLKSFNCYLKCSLMCLLSLIYPSLSLPFSHFLSLCLQLYIFSGISRSLSYCDHGTINFNSLYGGILALGWIIVYFIGIL